MSSYLQIIFSDRIKGIGFHEGGTYYGFEFFSTLDEVTKEQVAEYAIEKAEENWANGLIEDLANLKGQPVYIGSGEFDTTVPKKY